MPEIIRRKYIQRLSRHDFTHHLIRRFMTLPIAILLVFLYSSKLGLERRGVVTGLLTITIVSSMFISKGISLPVKTMQIKLEDHLLFKSLLNWIVVGSFVSQILMSLGFFYLTSYFNIPLFVLALFLAPLQSIQYFLSDIVFSKGDHRATANVESLSVILQFSFFVVLSNSNLSIASSIFLAFIFSSSVAILFLYRLLKTKMSQVQSKTSESKLKVFIKGGILWSSATTTHIHLERLMVLFLLGFSDFARYSMCTAFFVAMRTFGEVTNRFLIKPSYSSIRRRFKLLLILIIPIVLGLVLTTPFLLVVEHILGESWLIPPSIIFLSILNESLRLTIYSESIRQHRESHTMRHGQIYFSILIIAIFCSIYLHRTPELLDYYGVMALVFSCNFAIFIYYFSKKQII